MLKRKFLVAVALGGCAALSLGHAVPQSNPTVEEWTASFENNSLDTVKWERFTFEGGSGGTFKVENGQLKMSSVNGSRSGVRSRQKFTADRFIVEATVAKVGAALPEPGSGGLIPGDNGGRVVLLLDSSDALPAGSPLKLAARDGSDLDGNWVTNFNWIRSNTAPFDAVPFRRLLGPESASVVPRFLIQGVDAQDYDDVLSGIFYGWINQNGALAVQMNVGKGKLLSTTFRFGAYGEDPYATRLLDSMIHYAAGPQFAPKLHVTFNERKE